jgi:hypothetical protein
MVLLDGLRRKMGSLKLKKGSIAKLTGKLGAVSRFIEVVGSVT